MTARTLLYTIVLWILFIFAGFLSNWFGEMLAFPAPDEYYRHVCDILRLIAIVIALVYVFSRTMEVQQCAAADLIFIGFFWVAATVIYEFVYGHYFRGIAWNTAFADYNIVKGKLRAFVLLAELITPYLFGARRHSMIRRIQQDADGSVSESSSDG
jgi:hypothetical protein